MKDLSIRKYFDVLIEREDAQTFRRALRLANILYTTSECYDGIMFSISMNGYELCRFLQFTEDMGYIYDKKSFINDYLEYQGE